MKITQQVIHRKLKTGESLKGLDDLLQSGAISSYERHGDDVAVFTGDPSRFNALKTENSPVAQAAGVLKRAQNFLLPSDLKVSCAPEYLKFRAWSLAGATLSGMLGFMMSSVYLDSVKVAFSTSEKAAMAGVITGSIGKATQMVGWKLSNGGDSDPRKSFLVSSLISSANCVVGLGLLAALPRTNLAWGAVSSLTGTLAGIIGSAAGVNIFNHMASGPNKGEVATKNSNQDLIAGCMGMPGGVLLSHLGQCLGLNPALLAACTLGPLMCLCTVQAAAAVRMDAIDRAELEQIIDQTLATGSPPEAPKQGVIATLKSLFRKKAEPTSQRLELTDSLEKVGPAGFGTLRGEKYVLGTHGGKVQLAVRKDASFDDAFKGFVQARLLEQALDAGLPDKLAALGDTNPEATLVRLTWSAVPTLPGEQQLRDKGWHPNLAHLGVPTVDAAWAGPPTAPPRKLGLDDFARCLADQEALRSWLKG